MTSFTRRFGGQGISPAQLDYVGLALTGNVQLSWSFETGDDLVYGAYKTELISTTGAYAITLADATLVSDGQDISFINDTASTITIKSYGGSTIGTVASGLAWMFYLKDNSTQAGIWGSFQLGAGTSSASAASLAGYGLVAITTTLNQSHPVIETAIGVNLDATYRAQTIVSTGGAISFTFDPVATLGNNWFTLVRNSGTGTLTLNPNGAELIDGAATKALAPTESCFVICSGTKFYTVGYGRALTSTASAVSIDVTGTGDYTLAILETAAIVQDYDGVLSGNRVALYGNVPGEWAVFNNTSGTYTLTLKAGPGDTGIIIQQGGYAVVRSNGTTMSFATVASGSQTFTLDGTFTWPACKGALIDATSGGAGGARSNTTVAGASGGGGGGRAQMTIIPPVAGTTTAVTVGAGGAGATANNTVGTSGGDTVFGAYLTVKGSAFTSDSVTGADGGHAGTAGLPAPNTAAAMGWAGGAGAAVTVAGWGAEYGGGGGAGGQTGADTAGRPGGGATWGAGSGGGGGRGTGAGGAGGGNTGPTSAGPAGGTGGTGGAGVAGATGTNGHSGQGGGGGGGHSAGTGGIGGAGGIPGGGGGGGGAGNTSGNGGAGARGQVTIYWW